jgi:two-component system KDP operon response regulator KdpE
MGGRIAAAGPLGGQLRQKLEIDPAQPVLIQTEPAIGYRLTA